MFEWRPCICPAAFIKLNLQEPLADIKRLSEELPSSYHIAYI